MQSFSAGNIKTWVSYGVISPFIESEVIKCNDPQEISDNTGIFLIFKRQSLPAHYKPLKQHNF